jgi:hypothetical protein
LAAVPADPQGPYRDRLLARFLLGRWSIRMHTGAAGMLALGEAGAGAARVSLSPDLVWSSWVAGAAPGQRSYLSVMMRS